jgi:synaptosomal-associated protein 25
LTGWWTRKEKSEKCRAEEEERHEGSLLSPKKTKIIKPPQKLVLISIPEQLEKIETGMDSINADMQIAEKALKGMELCCGVFPKFWKK